MNPSRTRFHDMLPVRPSGLSLAANFGSPSQTTPSNSSGSQTKHQRSSSVPQPPPHCNGSYIYATPGTASSSASSADGRARSSSFLGSRSTAPSPLRYESNSVRSRSQATSQSASQQQPTRVPLYRTSSHNKASERPSPYPLYTPTVSFSSSRTASSSSIHPGSTSGHTYAPPRTSSSGSVGRSSSEIRPILKQNHTWHGHNSAPHAHVSFKNDPRGSSASNSLHVHPLLACSRLHNAPISYDITYTPSSRSVIDKTTNIAVAATTLAQPATNPPTSSRLVLKADKLPWPIVVSPSHVSSSSSSKPKSAPRFYIHGSHSGHGSSSSSGSPHVSNLDVLYAVHSTLFMRITQEEWEQLGHGSRSQRKITRAYEKRCIKMGGGWEGGVRRLDWLGGKTRLVGIELDKSGDGTGKLLFSKA
ncbi:DUF6699 domain-containing protein [Pleurotus pulmonarius]